MKSIFLFLIPTFFFAFSPIKTAPKQQPKTYAVTLHLTVNEWQSLVAALSNSDYISSGLSTRIQSTIQLQVNQQITLEQSEQKKQDSLSRSKQPIPAHKPQDQGKDKQQ